MNKRKVLVLAGHTKIALLSTRKELIEALLDNDYEVIIAAPFGEGTDVFDALGCNMVDVIVDRRGTSLFQDLKLIKTYNRIISNTKPDIVLSYNVKSNIYGGLVCARLSVPYITNITGLGTAIEGGGILRQFMLYLYKRAVRNAKCIFFQNSSNYNLFDRLNMIKGQSRIIPGSGVNIDHYTIKEFPKGEDVQFAFIGRVMRSKGIEEYLSAAKVIKHKHPETQFHVYGFCEDDYLDEMSKLEAQGIIKYHGSIEDVREVHKCVNCLINPSHHEGMSNVLLEASASARPVIAADIPGCRETFDTGVSGLDFEVKNTSSLVKTIEYFLQLSLTEQKAMGLAGRRKVEKEFSRELVIQAYFEEFRKLNDF